MSVFDRILEGTSRMPPARTRGIVLKDLRVPIRDGVVVL